MYRNRSGFLKILGALKLALSVWVLFEKNSVLLKILHPGQRREGTSSNYNGGAPGGLLD